MGRGRGRPKKEVDKEQFEKLCEIQCTKEAISNVLGISERTLYSWCKRTYGAPFADVFNEKREYGLCQIRNALYEVAVKDRNPSLLKYLGDCWLGLSDKSSQTNAGPEIDDEIEAMLAELDEE